MPSVVPPEVRSNDRPADDDEGWLCSGSLLRRGLFLLVHNEHLPCEMVLPKAFLPFTLNYQPLSSKNALIALRGKSGEAPLTYGWGFYGNSKVPGFWQYYLC